MAHEMYDRRSFIKTLGFAGATSAFPAMATSGHIAHEVTAGLYVAPAAPEYSIRFAVCGMSHDHIYGMVGAIQRGGGELVAAFGGSRTNWLHSPSAIPT